MNHDPVLLQECLTLASPKPGNRVLDCTLGLGGHAEQFLGAIAPTGTLVGLDADRQNLREAERRLASRGHCTFLHTNFSTLPDCLPPEHQTFDIILADLGLSSPHVDDPSRGFTFRADAPLDMRFDRERGLMAAHFLQSIDQSSLLEILQSYGELPRPHALVRAIVQRRSRHQLRRTSDLVAVATEVYGHRAAHYLPQLFQAVRIAVNDELGALTHFLSVLPALAVPGTRVLIISYHSLEDRLVKEAFRRFTTPQRDPVTGAVLADAACALLTRKAIRASPEEVLRNPRARSARLRALSFVLV